MANAQKINIKKTVEQSISGRKDFHFYVDELSPDNTLPTYDGQAEEKYSYSELDDDFFEFLERKSNENGIFIRLVLSIAVKKDNQTIFKLMHGECEEEFQMEHLNGKELFEFADYGVKIHKGDVTFGVSIDRGDNHRFTFEEIESGGGNLSQDNPLNRHVVEIMEGMVK